MPRAAESGSAKSWHMCEDDISLWLVAGCADDGSAVSIVRSHVIFDSHLPFFAELKKQERK